MDVCCTIEELSNILKISYSKAYSLVINGEIESFFISSSSNDRRISRESIERFMNIKNGIETEREKKLIEKIDEIELENLRLKNKLNSILKILI